MFYSGEDGALIRYRIQKKKTRFCIANMLSSARMIQEHSGRNTHHRGEIVAPGAQTHPPRPTSHHLSRLLKETKLLITVRGLFEHKRARDLSGRMPETTPLLGNGGVNEPQPLRVSAAGGESGKAFLNSICFIQGFAQAIMSVALGFIVKDDLHLVGPPPAKTGTRQHGCR